MRRLEAHGRNKWNWLLGFLVVNAFLIGNWRVICRTVRKQWVFDISVSGEGGFIVYSSGSQHVHYWHC